MLLASLLVSHLAATARAGEWPQILGPHRNGKADNERLDAWPKQGPPVAWQREVGQGLAGVAVAGGKAILFHRLGNELVAEAMDAASGKPLWKTTGPTKYVSTISSDNGPRCVPVIDRDRVFLFGPGGELKCVDLATGRELWFRQVYDEFKAPTGYFGAGSSPLVEDDKLLLNVGAPGGTGIVALSCQDGKLIWKATEEMASYSSPVATTLDGVRQVVFVTRLNVVSLEPRSGKVLFRFPFGARGPTVNGANPLILDGHLFVSASYGVGAQWLRLADGQATEEWESDDVMSSQYTTCVEHQGLLYGIDGRQDVGVARLLCFDPRTKKIHWTVEDFGTGSLILAGDKLLIMKTDGTLLLAEATPRAFRPLAETKPFDTTAQALPALAGGLLFIRDTQTLKCLRVGAVAKP
jgi:outer membrane protein assembly factor BamB